MTYLKVSEPRIKAKTITDWYVAILSKSGSHLLSHRHKSINTGKIKKHKQTKIMNSKKLFHQNHHFRGVN